MISDITNDMIRLRSEIAVLRSNMAQARDELRETVPQKLAEFREARQESAPKVRAELEQFVGRIKDAVTEIKTGVAVFRQQLQGDLADLHQAWWGAISTPARPRAAAEGPKDSAPKARKKKH